MLMMFGMNGRFDHMTWIRTHSSTSGPQKSFIEFESAFSHQNRMMLTNLFALYTKYVEFSHNSILV